MTSFMLVLVITATIVAAASQTTSEFSDLQEAKIRKLLKRLNKPALKSIKSPDGDIIDCVHISKQPAFDHPLLRNHTIQMRPSFEKGGVSLRKEVIAQVWHMNGVCPENTVPMQRTTKEDLLRASSVENYGRKSRKNIPKPQSSDATTGHEYAIMSGSNGMFYGTKATINLWNPEVQIQNEFSLAQIWVTAGDYSSKDVNSVEAGWQVYPALYSDSNTRLFVYWTRDAYQQTGCYNLKCPGFVQTNNEFVLGGSLAPTSSSDGSQYEITLLVQKDQETGNWWLQINDMNIGYWPASLYTHLANAGTTVQWGGEIVNRETNGQHTTTQMGSGHFAEEGKGKASYIRNIQVIDGSNSLRDPEGLQVISGQETCYNVKNGGGDASWGTHFFFGGPGRNPNCP